MATLKSTSITGATSLATVLSVDGVNGRLFSVDDDLSWSLMSVNTIAGIPVMEVFADNSIKFGQYGSEGLVLLNTGDIQTYTGKALSNTFVSGIFGTGYRFSHNKDITSESYLEIDNIMVRNTLRTHIFQKDVVKCTNGMLYVSDSGVITGFTGTTGAGTVAFSDEKSATFSSPMQLWFKDWNTTTGTILSVKFTIDSVASSSGGVTTYNVTCNSGDLSNLMVGGTATRITGGTILLDATSANSPFMDILDSATIHVRLGKLTGVGSLTGYGIWGSRNGSETSFYISSSGTAKIAGTNFNSDALYVGVGTWGNANTSVYLGASGLSLTEKFKVDTAGNLTATSATLTGSITATSGAIANWSITADRLYTTGIYLGNYNSLVGQAVDRMLIGNWSGTTYPLIIMGLAATRGQAEFGINPSYGPYMGFHSGSQWNVQLGALQNFGGASRYGIKITDNSANEIMEVSTTIQRISGWSLDNEKIYRYGVGTIYPSMDGFIGMNTVNSGSGNFYTGAQKLMGFSIATNTPGTAYALVMGQMQGGGSAIRTDYYGIQLMDHTGLEYFALGFNASNGNAYNRIAGWSFTNAEITGTNARLRSAGVLSLGSADGWQTANSIYIDGNNSRLSVGANMYYTGNVLTVGGWRVGTNTIDFGVSSSIDMTLQADSTNPSMYVGKSDGSYWNYAMQGKMYWASGWRTAFGYSAAYMSNSYPYFAAGKAIGGAVTVAGGVVIADGSNFLSIGDATKYFVYNNGNISWEGGTSRMNTSGDLTTSSITATGGAIGAWTLTSDSLYGDYTDTNGGSGRVRLSTATSVTSYAAGSYGKGLNVGGDYGASNAYNIWFGQVPNRTYSGGFVYGNRRGIAYRWFDGTTMFEVSNEYHASGGYNAFYASIAGWLFDSAKIHSSATGTVDGSAYTTTGMVIGATGFIAAPKFRVTTAGVLYATDGIFSGTITGSTITGGTVQTSAAGTNRISLVGSDETLRFYSNPTAGLDYVYLKGGQVDDVYSMILARSNGAGVDLYNGDKSIVTSYSFFSPTKITVANATDNLSFGATGLSFNSSNVTLTRTGAGALGTNAAFTATSLATSSNGALNLGSGTITSGTINGQTISSSANFSGSLTMAGGFTTDGTTATNYLVIKGGTGGGATNVGINTYWSNAAQWLTGHHSSTSYSWYSWTNSADEMTLDHSGNLITRGNVTWNGTPSDIRLKDALAIIDNPIQKLLALTGYSWTWNDKAAWTKVGQRDGGLVANEVQTVMPYAVSAAPDTILGLNYNAVTGLLVEGFKTHEMEIRELKARIKELENA